VGVACRPTKKRWPTLQKIKLREGAKKSYYDVVASRLSIRRKTENDVWTALGSKETGNRKTRLGGEVGSSKFSIKPHQLPSWAWSQPVPPDPQAFHVKELTRRERKKEVGRRGRKLGKEKRTPTVLISQAYDNEMPTRVLAGSFFKARGGGGRASAGREPGLRKRRNLMLQG